MHPTLLTTISNPARVRLRLIMTRATWVSYSARLDPDLEPPTAVREVPRTRYDFKIYSAVMWFVVNSCLASMWQASMVLVDGFWLPRVPCGTPWRRHDFGVG